MGGIMWRDHRKAHKFRLRFLYPLRWHQERSCVIQCTTKSTANQIFRSQGLEVFFSLINGPFRLTWSSAFVVAAQ
jgi:hypothetical protein